MMKTKLSLVLAGFAPTRWFQQTLRLAQFMALALVATVATVSAQTAGKPFFC